MQWDLHGTNVSRSPALDSYVEQRIIRRLSRFANGIKRLVLRAKDVDLSDLSSPREVTATVMLAGGQTVHVTQQSACFYSAVDAIGDRLRQVVRKRLDQRLFNARRRYRRRKRHQSQWENN